MSHEANTRIWESLFEAIDEIFPDYSYERERSLSELDRLALDGEIEEAIEFVNKLSNLEARAQ